MKRQHSHSMTPLACWPVKAIKVRKKEKERERKVSTARTRPQGQMMTAQARLVEDDAMGTRGSGADTVATMEAVKRCTSYMTRNS
jgi:hypothetical protein